MIRYRFVLLLQLDISIYFLRIYYHVSCVMPSGMIRTQMAMATQSSHKHYCQIGPSRVRVLLCRRANLVAIINGAILVQAASSSRFSSLISYPGFASLPFIRRQRMFFCIYLEAMHNIQGSRNYQI